MKIEIVLNGPGGELARAVINPNDDDSAEVSERIHDAIDGWVFAPGDVIVIREV